ncbi:MAG: hypothetical protein AAF429_13205 [Pseudomonadota bacterium]
MVKWILFLYLWSGIAVGQSLITPDEFEDISTGKTLHFNNALGYHGSEQYLSNREVRWRFANGQCQLGYWYDQNDAICFQYDNELTPMCWLFWQTERGIEAELLPQGQSSPLVLDFVDTRDILCGDYLGVKADGPVSTLLPPRAHP